MLADLAPPHGAGGRSGAWRHQGRAEISAAAVLRLPVARAAFAIGLANPLEAVNVTLTQHRPRRHLRSSRRRLLALQRRRALARAAFREDALRQCAAHRADDRGRGANRSRRSMRSASKRRSIGCCARWWWKVGVSPHRSMPTAKARRASSMCGVSPRFAEVLGEDGANFFAEIYGVTAQRQFRGPQYPQPARRHRAARCSDRAPSRRDARQAACGAAASRVRPGFDDKVLADWNGLMIAALANAAAAFDRPEWLAAAEAAFDFVCTKMVANGRLFHAYRAGEAKAPATANDYANMIRAALTLANVTGNRSYIERAQEWAERARPALLGAGYRRLLFRRRRHLGSHRAAA